MREAKANRLAWALGLLALASCGKGIHLSPVLPFSAPVPLTVSAISPTTGAKGTRLTVNGTGFLSTTTVLLGGEACTGVTLVSSTQLTCLVPGHSAGQVDVIVQNDTTSAVTLSAGLGSSRVDLQACKLEYSIVSPK